MAKEKAEKIYKKHEREEKREKGKKKEMPKKKGKVARVMKEYSENKLHSGSKTGPKVTSKAQAIAIALSEARNAGKKRK
jgi:hypothetical protein